MTFNVQKKFQIYNALFLNLGYTGANDFAHLIPILGTIAKQKLADGNDPIQIFDEFFTEYDQVIGIDKLDFMFRVIQYVERQIVLFDSVEDSVSPYSLEDQDTILIPDVVSNTSDKEDFFDRLNEFAVRIVLTAHPTQFYRPPVLDIISKLRKQVKKNQIDKIDSLLHQMGLTSLINTKSPTPLEEAKNIIHFCRYEYYDAIGEFIYNLEQEYPQFNNEDLVMLGFWPGGDRDGNAFVTHEVTKNVIHELRMTLMKCYYQDVKNLKSKLTFRNIEEPLTVIQNKLYNAMFDPKEEIDDLELVDTLQSIRKELLSNFEGLYLESLDKVITKMRVFRKHFASLDIRQDHSVHVLCIEKILTSNGIINISLDELSEEKLVHLLMDDFVDIPTELNLDGLVLDTVRNIQQLPELQKLNGETGCHRYIISNSEDIFSVLFVLGLFRWIHKSEEFAFDIVPLFETIKGMNASEEVMQTLYSNPVYNKHLSFRKKKQTIMLGFSDGTKDGGYLKANWSIYNTKEVLSKVSKKNGISVAFFDGRGGPPARGGGKTYNFYAARSSNVANNDIQLTIQGQTITSTYGTSEKFVFNAEQMVSSGMRSLEPDHNQDISKDQQELMNVLSELSYTKYIDLKEHPRFLGYLENMTTLKYYANTKVGSRPGKRNKNSELSLTDLRAISYVGSWSQLKQNIPGFYGIGTALEKLVSMNKLDELQDLYQNVSFFKTLIDNSMMSLTKCNFELTFYMKSNPEYGEFWENLYAEYLLSKKMILKIAQIKTLMENEQRTKLSIQTRDEIVMPLLIIQQYALQMISKGIDPEHRETYEKLVTRSMYGNINASRNSA